MDKVLYKLENFEGPLDLLLHLITKNKMSIYDIPIVEITDQYLDAMVGIEESQLDNTSEFLVLAAQLVYIKSKMLLPKEEDETEDEEDPREDLARRLIEYQKFKEASKELRKTELWSQYMFFKGEERWISPPRHITDSTQPPSLLRHLTLLPRGKCESQNRRKKPFSA